MKCNKEPCPSCPYRKDVPSGVWDKSEYEKLRDYDNNNSFALFLCHYSKEEKDIICKGWAVVHAETAAVRIHVLNGNLRSEDRYNNTVPVFASGNEAADHGEKKISRPSREAIQDAFGHKLAEMITDLYK